MAKYKILKDFVLNGVQMKEGEVVDLTSQHAKLKSIKDNIEKVSENAAVANKDGSALSSVQPGTPLTPEQREKLAKENAAASAEANRLASERQAQDIREGKGEPVVKGVAEALKGKLENNEFQKKENEPPQPAQPTDGGQA